MRNRVVWLTVVFLIGFIGLSPTHAQPGVNELANGNFEEGAAMPLDTWAAGTWNVYGNHTAAVVSELTGAAVPEGPAEGKYCLHITVPAAGANFWDVGLQNLTHTFKKGKKYTLSAFFKCKSGTLQVNMKPELGQDPWTGYGERQITMTDKWAEYSTTTSVFAADVTPGTLTFHIAFAPGDFWVDNVRWYEGDYVAPGSTLAHDPNPADGAVHSETWASLSWKPGDFAVSHDVYFGTNRDDVDAGTGNTFSGNQVSTFFVVGFPGFPYPDGLIPGTTYYWRIDEVNKAHADSPWKGKIWSFMVPPKKAFEPNPPDTAKFIDTKVTLSWKPGFSARLHQVFFGENSADVAAGTGGTAKGPSGTTTYTPSGLQAGKTYYWRVDEFDGVNTYKGDVWSFTTARIGGGIRADYYKGMNFENRVLTRTDPKIDFNWGNGAPDPAVGVDGFSVRWTGEVEAAFTETYTFYPRTDDGVRLYVDGQLLADSWVDRGPIEDFGTINLIAGNTYSLVMEYYENGGGAVAELRWSSPRTPKQIIPQAALSLPVKASSPNPRSGSVDVKQSIVLTWGAGDDAASHEVYFGTDEAAVKNATKTSPQYKGSKPLGTESYDPGKLAWAATYYWRVDEVNTTNPASPWVGNVWSFTTAEFLIIDDFESYDAGANQIWYSWHDGLGYGAPGTPPYFAGNGTGAAVGDENTASFTEETIVHGGEQSMPLSYNNNKQGFAKYSEAEYKLTAVRDWTEEGVSELSLWFRGMPGSVGSFTEAPAGTFTMTASGTDIWDVGTAGNYRDEFHYAYKTLTGAGSIIARVQSVQNTDGWAKAGVMIRETLEPGSKHAFAAVTPSNGVASQGRIETGGASFNTNQGGVTAPYWVKLERDVSGRFTVSHSANGTTWVPVTGSNPTNIQMTSTVYVGLAVTAHNATATCKAVFTNVTTTGTVSPQWAHQDIGIASNAAERLYVAVSNATGNPAVVVHDNPAAAQINAWTKWTIPLTKFSDQGINLKNVDKIAIGLGTRGNMTTAGGSGKMYFDDIRVSRAAQVAVVNLLTNGGFEDGVMAPWGIWGATAEVVTTNPAEGKSCLHVTVPQAGANFWDSGLNQSPFVFQAGKKYTFSAWLRCKQGTMRINFKPELQKDPWTGYGEQVITMSDQWVEYSVTTPVLAADVNPGSATFHIGFDAGEFWIDGVRFYEGDFVPSK